MTAHSQASTTLPGMQSSATVLEFICLYTPDIRKKQKKWFDGRLKYHTFNKKVMLYDERFNFVGDTHWREDYDLEEGDEFQTERSSCLVQVAECVGRREQDLTELLDKRLKEKEERRNVRAQLSSPLRTPAGPRTPRETPMQDVSQLQPRPLSTLLGTLTGHYGRAAVPMTSPFEDRQRARQIDTPAAVERPTKRRKPDEPPNKSGYAQNLTGATLTLSRPPSSISSSWLWTKTSQKATVDLTDDNAASGLGIIKPAESSSIQASRTDRTERPLKKARIEKPERSTYAGNLTGAALVFSNPPPSRATSEASKICRKTHREPVVPIDTPEEVFEAGEGFIDVDLFSTQPTPPSKRQIQKSRRGTTKETPIPLPTLQAIDVPEAIKRNKRTQAEKSALTFPIQAEDGEHQEQQQVIRTDHPSFALPSDMEDVGTAQYHSKSKHRKAHPDQAGIAEKESDHTRQKKPRAKWKKDAEAALESPRTDSIIQTPVTNLLYATESGRKQAFSTLRIKARPARNKLMLMSTPLKPSPTSVTQDEDDELRDLAHEHEEAEGIDYRTIGRLLTRGISEKSSAEEGEMTYADEEGTDVVAPPADIDEDTASSRTSLSRVDFISMKDKGSSPRPLVTKTAQVPETRNAVSMVTTIVEAPSKAFPRTSPLANISHGSAPRDEGPIENDAPAEMGDGFGASKAQVHLANHNPEGHQRMIAPIANLLFAEGPTGNYISKSHLTSSNDNDRLQHLNVASRPLPGSSNYQRSNCNDVPTTRSAGLRHIQLKVNHAQDPLRKTTVRRFPSIFNLFNGDQDPDTLVTFKAGVEWSQSSPLAEVPSNIESSSDDVQIRVQDSLGFVTSKNGCSSNPVTGNTLDPVAATNTNSIDSITSKAESPGLMRPQARKMLEPNVNNPPIRIANPATRGRKAALRSDAAGKAPESIVGLANAMLPPPAPRRPTVNAPDRPREPVYRPVSDYVADKGAWTIEAFDMFDWHPPPIMDMKLNQL